MTNTTKAIIGSISHGTLRNEDLLEAFADELERIRPDDTHKTLAQWRYFETGAAADPEIQSELVNELADALNEVAPPFCYFGAHEGDPSDFGFWPDHDAIQELIDESTVYGVGKNGEIEYLNIHEGMFIQVNDHGNLTICDVSEDIANPRGMFNLNKPLLSIV